MALTKIDDRGLKTPIDLLDNEKIRLGTGNDLDIFHDSGSTKSMINNQNGELRIVCDNAIRIGKRHDATIAYADNMIVANPDGAVELYFDNSKKLETFDQGVSFVGSISGGDGDQVRLGGSDDIKIYHHLDHNYFLTPTGFPLIVEADNLILRSVANEEYINCTANGAVNLYYDGSQKFETESTGAKVTGMLGVNVTPDTSASSTYVLQLKGAAQCYMAIGNDTTGTGYNNGVTFGCDATDAYLYNRENTPLHFGINNTTKFSMKTGGQFQIIDGDLQLANGHGIDFSATSDATGKTSELLDDYEEGTWTPGLASGNVTQSNGTYTKVGRLVNIWMYMQVASNSSSASMNVTGMPFAPWNTTANLGGTISVTNQGTYFTVFTNNSDTTFYLRDSSNISKTQQDFSTKWFYVQASYQAA